MNKNRKLTINNHWAIASCFLKIKNTAVIRLKIKFKKIANCPKITKLPVIKGKGKIPFAELAFLLESSIKLRAINTKKLRLQIKVILEKNFILQVIGMNTILLI